jgi:arylsulfatase A-like enzyme
VGTETAFFIERIMRIPIILLLAFLLGGCRDRATVGSRTPNIVFILADDLGYGELGCYGQQLIETPNIDRLAAQGMRFTDHYSGSPVCAPSRCVLLTGLHSGHTYIRGNDEWRERGEVWDFAKAVEDPALEGQRPIPDSVFTLAEMLREAGYATAAVGKWGLGAPGTEGVPNRQGFDLFFGYNCQRQAHTYYPRHLWRNEEKVWLDNPLVPPHQQLDSMVDPDDPAAYASFSLADYSPDLMLAEALQFIRQQRDKPFFLYFASPIPHMPLQAPEKWVRYYRDKFGDEAPYAGDQGYFPHRYPRAAYAAMVSCLDEQVGAITATLEELNLAGNTLVFFSSDNGPTYTGGADSEFFSSARPFRSDNGRGKGYLYEGGIRVPFIAAWPGRIEPGTLSAFPSAFFDLMPTIAELTEQNAPGALDGISLMPVLLGTGAPPSRSFLYWEFPQYNGQQALRMGKWKAIRKNIAEGNLQLELYDLANDPAESQNLAAAYPEIVARMDSILAGQHRRSALERFQLPALGD